MCIVPWRPCVLLLVKAVLQLMNACCSGSVISPKCAWTVLTRWPTCPSLIGLLLFHIPARRCRHGALLDGGPGRRFWLLPSMPQRCRTFLTAVTWIRGMLKGTVCQCVIFCTCINQAAETYPASLAERSEWSGERINWVSAWARWLFDVFQREYTRVIVSTHMSVYHRIKMMTKCLHPTADVMCVSWFCSDSPHVKT